ncbi:MAG: hypothetical protein F6K39_04175 [Okeania sp. SIO3B3]|nr:hypothetical protein [Okeania sp. SIO3B3]
MTEKNTVIIYEFRSNFTYQDFGSSWRSTGFYGSPYIGITFDNGIIPEPLQRATGRQDSRFDVSQKIDYQSFINSPYQSRDSVGFKEFNERFVCGNALVGRIIEKWAVLAVVSVAIDFANRIFPVKRYFCCPESDDKNYDAMVTLIRFFFDGGLEDLTFDILENKPQKSYQVYPLSSQALQSLDWLNCDYSKFDGLRLLKPGLDMSKNNLLKMWKTCLSLVSGNRKKAAWALNVDLVANPTDFTLIQAGTQEFFDKNYSTFVLPPPPSSKDTTANQSKSYNVDAESVFYDFIEKGNLSQKQIKFITTGIQQNYKQWEKLATKSRDEIIIEFNSFSSLIRYYTLSALIVPERAVDLFQQLLFSKNDVWKEFLKSAKYFKYFQQRQNASYLKESIEEGVWLIINYIIEDRFELPPKKNFRLYQAGKLKRFFTEEDNIWIKGIFWSHQKLLITESSDTRKQKDSTSSSFQDFLHNLDNERYTKKHKKGYEKITQIFSQSSKKTSYYKKTFFFFQYLIEQKFKSKVKEKTVKGKNIQEIVNVHGLDREIGRRSPQSTPSINGQQIIRNWLYFINRKISWRSLQLTPSINGQQIIRNWLYFIVGLLASVLAWSFSQVLLVDFKPIWDSLDLTFFAQYPYLIKFFILTIFLAVFMVMAEVFFSHPTRLKQGWKVLKFPLIIAIIASILGASLSGIMSFVLKLTGSPALIIRLIDWLIIGGIIGFAEGITWLLRTWNKLVFDKVRRGGETDMTKVINHFVKSIFLSLLVSFIVFIFSEINTKQDVWSFTLLGSMLGLALSFTESPNTQFALKAGYGFERIAGGNTTTNNLNRQTYKDRGLRLVYVPPGNQPFTIEEGLSIEFPKTGSIVIGSDVEQADIIVDDLPHKIATIKINGRKATIKSFSKNILKKFPSEVVIKPPEPVNNIAPNPYATAFNNVSNQSQNNPPNLDQDSELINYPNEIELYHNTIITLYTKNQNYRKYVRFVFYDRFLDPEA